MPRLSLQFLLTINSPTHQNQFHKVVYLLLQIIFYRQSEFESHHVLIILKYNGILLQYQLCLQLFNWPKRLGQDGSLSNFYQQRPFLYLP